MSSIATAFLCMAANGAPAQTSSGAQSPAIGHNAGTINYYNNYQVKRPVSSKLNSLERKREALLMAENPTVLELTGIEWTKWFGDGEPYLTVHLSNRSKLPALNVQVDALNKETGATIASLKPFSFPKSYTMKILADQKINISAGAGWGWPLAPLRSVEKIIGSDCITGGGLDFDNTPVHLADSKGVPSGLTIAYNQQAIYLRVSYETIFEEKISFTKSVVIDSAPRSQTHVRERGSARAVPLRCVGSPPGFTVG
ncbi:hypothetical protein [Massilia sp. DD77]|uniref:hypothetical protein n=1 Tax=Massilia sp. DD77 TaxID=3109349 RepID=UPI0030000DC5